MSDRAAEVERLVAELKATGTLWPETVSDLERYVEEAKGGSLWEEDYSYLVALHAKVVNGEAADGQPIAPELTAAEWRERAERAESRFEELKRRFEVRYRPSADAPDTPDAQARAALFNEFWAEIEDVERS